MAVSAKVGSFAMNTSTGNQAITGVGFQPTCVIFFANNGTADGGGADAAQMFGVAASSTSRGSIYTENSDAASASKNCNTTDNAHCITFLTKETTTVTAQADFVTMDVGGFTINVGTADATSRIINYIALGGDITNAFVGSGAEPTATGTKAYTGVGFQPDCVLTFAATRVGTTLPNAVNNANSFVNRWAWSTASSAEKGIAGSANYTTSLQLTSVQKTIAYERAGSAVSAEADMSSLDSDGFTLNFTTASATAVAFLYLCLKGGTFKIGAFNQKTSTGSQATTGIGITPAVVLFASRNRVAGTAINSQLDISLGAGSSSTARGHVYFGGVHASSPTNTSFDLDRANVIKMLTANSATPTTNAAADLTSLDSDGWTLNYGTADATAREIIYLAIGSVSAVVTTTTQSMFQLLGVGT